MITFRGIVELRKAFCVLPPIKLPGINYDSANRCTVTSNPFGCRVYDNICTVVDGPAEIATRAKGVVHL